MTEKRQKLYEVSRYGDPRYITDVGGGCYIIEGKSKFVRVGGDTVVDYIDFEGGPFIGVGASLYEDKKVIVESIQLENSGKDGWTKISVTAEES
jgi:hypothetical protein